MRRPRPRRTRALGSPEAKGLTGRAALANAWLAYGLQDVIMLRKLAEDSEADELHKRRERQRIDRGQPAFGDQPFEIARQFARSGQAQRPNGYGHALSAPGCAAAEHTAAEHTAGFGPERCGRRNACTNLSSADPAASRPGTVGPRRSGRG